MIQPTPEELGALPLHVLVRDLPETLAVLRRHSVDVAASGAETLATLVSSHADLMPDILSAIAWRDFRA